MSSRKIFDLIEEPTGTLYRDLIFYALKYCETVSLVVNPSYSLGDTGNTILEYLGKYLMNKTETSEWPGTILYGKAVWAYQYKFNIGCAEILSQSVKGLYQWLQPNLPEDICLRREDGTPWLVSIAHEQDGYFLLTEIEKQDLAKNLLGLRITARK